MQVALAATHHDPEGRLDGQTARMLPRLGEIYCYIAIVATPASYPPTLSALQSVGASIKIGDANAPTGHLHLGLWRRIAVELGVRSSPTATHIHFCDFDRVLHWVEFYPDELRDTTAALSQHDFTVLGRTPRAFASHPRVQRDTETIVNHTFGLASGLWWDVTAASRGLSCRAADTIVDHCHDDSIGTDCSWPLFLRNHGELALGYLETEGLEFETLDRYADEIAALGGPEAWIARMDNDPRQWAYRLEMARVEVETIVAFA